MSEEGAQLSNPFSTGGGGLNFERHVQAGFIVLMLTGGVVPFDKAGRVRGKPILHNSDALAPAARHGWQRLGASALSISKSPRMVHLQAFRRQTWSLAQRVDF